MMLTEETQVASAALPLQEFKDHLRLATGFADANTADGYLEELLRAALAAVEGRTGKALFARDFRLALTAWRDCDAQPLPVAPVSAVVALTITDKAGVETVVDPVRYQLEADMQRPRLIAYGTLPTVPTGGTVDIVFTGGFGPAWSDIPVDLRQAVLLIGAGYFERRHEEGAEAGAMPFGVMALLDRWRTVRSFGGGRP